MESMVLMRRKARWVTNLALSLLVIPASSGWALRPAKLSWPKEFDFEAYQAVHSDARGKVWLFRGDQGVVHPLGEDGRPLTGQPLEGKEPISEVREAVMDRSGTQWLLLERKPRYFKDGKEVALGELPFIPFAVGFLGEQPLLGLKSMALGRTMPQNYTLDTLPWVALWDGGKWKTLATHRQRTRTTGDSVTDTFELSQLSFVPTQKEVVVVSRFEHRWYWLDTQGKVRWTVATPGDPPKPSANYRKEVETNLREELVKKGVETQTAQRASFAYASSLRLAILGMTACGDGTVYIVVSGAVTGKGPALERWDPSSGTLQRVPFGLDYGGRLTLACAKNGLYFAAYQATSGRWFVDFETLEKAPWEEVAVDVLPGGFLGQ